MACSPEQIAAKRQQALDRLKQNKEKSPEGKFNNGSITSGQFYGSGQGSSTTPKRGGLPGKVDNKMKVQPLRDNRIFSQPYPNKGKPNIPEAKDPQKYWPGALMKTVCNCILVSPGRFSVTLNKFDQAVMNAFNQIGSMRIENSVTTFDFQDYKNFLKVMGSLGNKVTVSPLPPFLMKIMSTPIESMDMSFLSSIEPKLVNALLDFQKEGVRFAIEKQGRCIIADEMGLGKTYQALAVADFYRDDWPVLICTVATTRDMWANKIRELLPRVPVHKIIILNSAQNYISDASFIICSYAMMALCVQKIMAKKCGILIMDESHSLKNSKAKCTIAAMTLLKNARRVILLTGTPAVSRPSELFTQLLMCDRTFFSYKEYTKRYCEGHESQFGWDANGSCNMEELEIMLRRKFMIRRKKNEVMNDMTDKTREVVVLDRELVDNKHFFKDLVASYEGSTGKRQNEILLTFYTATADAKLRAVCSYVKNVLKTVKKFIVFAYHHVMLDALSECLKSQNVDFIRIDGDTDSNVRSQLVDLFQTKPHYRVAVLSIKACNAGITLTAAQLVIFAELYWNPSTLAQGESRSHRIGQDQNVVVRYLLAKGTADDIIWSLIRRKQNVLNDAGLGSDDFNDVSLSRIEVSSTPKITDFFTKTPEKSPAAPQPGTSSSNVPKVSCDGDYKQLLEEDDDVLADFDF
uniref:Putative chromatin remodeling protein n=1 Tax=Phlebotomus kandelakii TaxID=1109342 RepID=A0A6B2E974_9DIPT